jgi:hypothetical protein
MSTQIKYEFSPRVLKLNMDFFPVSTQIKYGFCP